MPPTEETQPAPHTEHAPAGMAQVVDQALMSAAPDAELEALFKSGILSELYPEVTCMVGFGGAGQGHKDLWEHTKTVVAQTVPRRAIRWAALFHDVGKVETFSRDSGKVTFHSHEMVSARAFDKAARRTELDRDLRKHIRFLVRYLGYVESYADDWTESAVRRVQRDTEPYFEDLVALARADITTKHDHKRRQHQVRMDTLSERAREIARKDAELPLLPKGLGTKIIQELAIAPGPRIGELMDDLKKAVENGELEPRAELDVYVRYLKDRV
jgi:poly(A) polymerase